MELCGTIIWENSGRISLGISGRILEGAMMSLRGTFGWIIQVIVGNSLRNSWTNFRVHAWTNYRKHLKFPQELLQLPREVSRWVHRCNPSRIPNVIAGFFFRRNSRWNSYRNFQWNSYVFPGKTTTGETPEEILVELQSSETCGGTAGK